MSNDYRPEIDVSPELDATDAAYYQSLIGILQWMVELGRVDICTEVSMLSSCLALPSLELVICSSCFVCSHTWRSNTTVK